MTWLVIGFLALVLAGSIWLNIVTVKQNLTLSDQREALVDTIEESLDVLDEVYQSISHSADIPVLSDEPVIRDVISDIKRARNAVLAIAGKVVIYGQEEGAARGDE